MDAGLLKIKMEQNPVHKKLRFLAWLTSMMRKNGRASFPVLVGGGAVEVYTAGNYATKDIDIVYGDIALLDKILLPEGFKKEGRYWYNEEIDIILECPGSGRPESINNVVIDGEDVFITSLEDIIVDRLCAYKFWKSADDGLWAKTMLKASSTMDLDYLQKRASEEDVEDVLAELSR